MRQILLVLVLCCTTLLMGNAQIRSGDGISVVTRASVVQTLESKHKYQYSVKVSGGSAQPLVSFTVELDKGAVLDSLQVSELARNWGGSTTTPTEKPLFFKGAEVSWVPLDTLENLSDQTKEPRSAIQPLDSLIVDFTTLGLPGISRYWAEGWYAPLTEREYDSLRAIGLNDDAILKPWHENAAHGSTVAPVNPPSPFTLSDFLDTLTGYVAQSRSLNWITSQTIADKYLGYFISAKSNLQANNIGAARATLQQVLNDVKIDSSSTLTSEAYALLYFNTEYLLSQLPEGESGVSSYSLFATHSLWLEQNSSVFSGDIGVNDVGTAPFLDSQVELSIGIGTTTASGYSIKANRIKVKQGATVGSGVYYNELDNNGTITGTLHTPLSLPLVSSLPEFKVSTPGTQNITIPQNGTQTLQPGSYGDIDVKKNGRLILTGGEYHLSSFTGGDNIQLVFQSPAIIRIAGKFDSGQGSSIGPEDTTTVTAKDIVFYVAGINGSNGNLGATPKAAKIGISNTVRANFYVPNGTLWIRQNSEVTGAFVGKDVDLGIGVKVWLKSAF